MAGLADDGDDGGLGIEEGFHAGVFFGFGSAAAGHAEGGDFGGCQLDVGDFFEEGGVLWIGEGESAFDVIYAEEVEFLGDLELVLKGEVEAFALGAVAEGCVVDFYASGFHGSRPWCC